MPNRIIKESICTSETIDSLSPFQEIFFYRLLVNCDDYGCMDARVKVLAARLFPLRDVKEKEIENAVEKLAEVGLIGLYEVDGRRFMKVLKWADHQRVRVSKHKFPEPDEAQLAATRGNSRQLAANGGNLRPESQSESESESESNIEREPRKRFSPPSVEEVAEYCRERKNNVDAERFVDFYASKGWRVGAQPMRDWKASVRTWEKRDKAPAASGPGKIVSAQMYEQRDYSQEEDADAVLNRLKKGG